MDSRKRPGSDIEAFSDRPRKNAKSSDFMASPYDSNTSDHGYGGLSREEFEIIERNRREAEAKRKAFLQQSSQSSPLYPQQSQTSTQSSQIQSSRQSVPASTQQPRPNPFFSKQTSSPQKSVQSSKITNFFSKSVPNPPNQSNTGSSASDLHLDSNSTQSSSTELPNLPPKSKIEQAAVQTTNFSSTNQTKPNPSFISNMMDTDSTEDIQQMSWSRSSPLKNGIISPPFRSPTQSHHQAADISSPFRRPSSSSSTSSNTSNSSTSHLASNLSTPHKNSYSSIIEDQQNANAIKTISTSSAAYFSSSQHDSSAINSSTTSPSKIASATHSSTSSSQPASLHLASSTTYSPPLQHAPLKHFDHDNGQAEATDGSLSKFVFGESHPHVSHPNARKKLLQGLGTSDDGEENDTKFHFAREPRDFSGKRPGDPGYNPTQLYIPPDVYSKFSAAKKQYWDYKKNHFDEIVFFQQGDFFNLFATDADISIEKFGFAYNKNLDSVGFNRKQLRDWATKFANMGFKVTVLEQDSTATTDESKKSKSLVKKAAKATEDRSVTNKITSGTINDFEMFEDDASCKDALARYLLVISEYQDPKTLSSAFGISFIDTSTYEWGITHFIDDSRSSQLETLLLRLRPREILYDRSNLSKQSKKILDVNLSCPCYSFLQSFPSKFETESLLSQYFNVSICSQEDAQTNIMQDGSLPYLPKPIFNLMHGMGLDTELALGSVGAAIQYFKQLTRTASSFSSNPAPAISSSQSNIDHVSSLDVEITSRARYFEYSVHSDPYSNTMIIDSIALSNLEILENNDDGSDKGTLISVLDNCMTSFGRRRLRQWVCHPLRQVDDIISRQSCVSFFFCHQNFLEQLRGHLSKVKDLERLITRVQSKSISISLFIDFLDSMEMIYNFIDRFKNYIKDFKVYDPLIQGIHDGESQSKFTGDDVVPVAIDALVNHFPDLEEFFRFFGFDRVQARKENCITPLPGTNPKYDEAQKNILDCNNKLELILQNFKRELNDSTLSYHIAKTEMYSIAVTKSSTKIPKDWTATKAKAGNRYRAPEVDEVLELMNEASADLARATSGVLLDYLESFCQNFTSTCSTAIGFIAQLDALMSLARYSCSAASEAGVCRPVPYFIESEIDPLTSVSLVSANNVCQKPFISISMMKHPFVTPAAGTRFIPNSVELGTSLQSPPILLVTGPNMGGKSTLLRQTCILMIMAQLGCYVPAERFHFSPADRIFTRIGARDNLISGQSTFMIELEETAKVLNLSTSNSLVILDELGRGTSTFDGYAIAYSVLKHLENQNSRVLFSTHYHKLTQEFQESENINKVQQGHMACREENGNMTFLYSLVPGPCPNSFGLEVAKMANIPYAILTRASIMSDMFEVMVDKKGSQIQDLKKFSFARLVKLLGKSNKEDVGIEIQRLWKQARYLDATC